MSLAEKLGVGVLLAISATFHTTHLVTAAAVSVAEAVIAYLLCGGKCGFSLQTVPAAAAAISFAVTRLSLSRSPRMSP